MEHNVGEGERIIRILAGVAIVGLILVLEGPAKWLGLIGIVPIATGIMAWCPPYALLGINTCKTR